MARNKRLRAFFGLLLIASDLAMTAIAFYLAYELRLVTDYRPLISIPPFRFYLGMGAIQVISMPVVFFFAKLYHIKRAGSRIDEFYSVFGSVSVGTLISTSVTSFIYKGNLDYPRLMVIYAWVLTILLVTVGRLLHGFLVSLLRSRGAGADRVLIVGTGEAGRMLLQKVQNAPRLGYQAVGFIDGDSGLQELDGLPVLGSTENIGQIIDDNDIDAVLIGLPEASREQVMAAISQCERGKVEIKVLPDVFQLIASELSIGELDGLPMLTVRDVALRGWRLTVKRAFDLALGSVLLVLSSPFLLLVAALVKLESPGPALFVQERVGLDARPFPIVKFRTMRTDAEGASGPVWAKAGDPRRTRLGTFLRKHSLDELPQLINVVLGEMSLVGPRPERPVFVEQFRQSIPRYMDRHREKAGMAGWAQINGLRGDTSIEERTKYDLWYVENWSLLLDIKILLRAIMRVFRDPNAY
jgi:exopolysaccharide biosynthesis polyprenyl glycosylphosphotransferase